jgi:hypothetical protein
MAAPLMKGLLNLLASKNSVDVAKKRPPGCCCQCCRGWHSSRARGRSWLWCRVISLLNYPLMRAGAKDKSCNHRTSH